MLSRLGERRSSSLFLRFSLNVEIRVKKQMASVALCVLRSYDRLATAYECCKARLLQMARTVLGYEEERILVLENEVVVRTTGDDVEGGFLYDPVMRRIVGGGRLRPVPFVSLTMTMPSGVRTDLSDWVGELRTTALPFPLTAVHLVKVWFAARGLTCVPSGTTLQYTTNLGEEQGKTIQEGEGTIPVRERILP